MPDVLHPEGGPDEDESDDQGRADDGGDFVAAGTARDRIQAELLAQACEDAGIPAIVKAPRESMVGKLDAPTDSLSILVREADLARAQSLIAERRAELEADPDGAARAAEEEEAAGETTPPTGQ